MLTKPSNHLLRRNNKLVLTIGAAVALSGCLSSTLSKPPNIVIFYTDDQPQRAFGYLDDFFSTPNMDRLKIKSTIHKQY